MDRPHKLSEADESVLVSVECSEHVPTKVLGVSLLREECFVCENEVFLANHTVRKLFEKICVLSLDGWFVKICVVDEKVNIFTLENINLLSELVTHAVGLWNQRKSVTRHSMRLPPHLLADAE